jgi:hypothetical protein
LTRRNCGMSSAQALAAAHKKSVASRS